MSPKPVLVAAALAALVIALPSALAGSAQEPPRVCEGLTICSPVGGPWVIVPGPAGGAQTAGSVWMIGCPRGGIVGGTDARVGDPWVEVSFAGRVGAPVNPGITTGREVLFTAVSVGPRGRPSSFIPFIGCMPSEGGPRTPTTRAAPSQYPRQATIRRVRVVDVRAERASVGLACKPNERLVSSTTATGIYTSLKPNASQLRGVRVTRSVSGRRIFVTIRRVTVPRTLGVEVQVHALCAGRLAK
jgi:hypothetical protein